MSSLLFSIGIILATLAITVGGLIVFRKIVSVEVLKIDHEVTTALIAVLGTLYAIVLGLVVVDALAHREQAQLMESTEANALATILHLSKTLPKEQRRPILRAELNYCEAAIDKEWDAMNKGTAPDSDTVDAFNHVWESVTAYDPQTNKETNIHSGMLTALADFSNSRRFRIVACKHGLPFLLWVILIVGGMCTIGFTFFFGAERIKLQLMMTSIVAFMLILNLLLVYFYGSPYQGDMKIDPSALEHVRQLLRHAPILHPETSGENQNK